MPIEQKTVLIGDTEYQFQTFGLAANRKCFVHLANLAGPMFHKLSAELSAKAKGSKNKPQAGADFLKALGDMDVTVLGSIGGEFLQNLEEEDLIKLEDAFGPECMFKPKNGIGFIPFDKAQREIQFSGSGILDYFKWLWSGIEVNYGGLFIVGSALAENARARPAKKAKA